MKVGDVSGASPIDRGGGHNKKEARKAEANEKRQPDKIDLSPEARQKADGASGATKTSRSEQVYGRPSPERKQMDDDDQKLVQALIGQGDDKEDSSSVRKEKIEEAREKMKSGEYSDKKVIDKVARRIMEQFGLNNR